MRPCAHAAIRSASVTGWGWTGSQEARTLARFDHPNIVRVHSVFEFNGTAYMVMRFEEGENFGTLLERRGRPRSYAPSNRS